MNPSLMRPFHWSHIALAVVSVASASAASVSLGGSGSIGGVTTISAGGALSPGHSIESITTGSLTFASGATYAYETNNDSLAIVAGDLTAVAGNLTLTELGSGSWTVGEKLTLISYSGTWSGGLFGDGGVLADATTFSYSGSQWQFSYNDVTQGVNYVGDLAGASYVPMSAIPEPGAVVLGAFGLLTLLRRRRA